MYEPLALGMQELGMDGDDMDEALKVVAANEGYATLFAKRLDDVLPHYGGSALLVKKAPHLYSIRAVEVQVGKAWEKALDVTCATLDFVNGGSLTLFNVYAHYLQEAVHGFRLFCQFVRQHHPGAIVLGDLNADLQERARPGHVADRRLAVQEQLVAHGWRVMENDKPTMRDSPTSNDYVIVGPDISASLRIDDETARVLDEAVSDHCPVLFTAQFQHAGIAALLRKSSLRNIKWRAVTDKHVTMYNRAFRNALCRAAFQKRDCAAELEKALLVAQRCLPKSRPPPPGAATDAHSCLFWSLKKEDELRRSDDPASVIRRCQRDVLNDAAKDNSNPGSVWDVVNKYMRTKRSTAPAAKLKDPEDPGREVSEPADVADVLAKAYAKMHTVAGDGVRYVQTDIAAALDAIPPALRRSMTVASWELASAIDLMSAGKCADASCIKAEHLHLLDGKSRRKMLPWVDRVVCGAEFPKHWKTATTTGVPKKKRDPSLVKSRRPVSVCATLSRMCENIVSLRVVSTLELAGAEGGPDVKAQSQFGFRKGLSTKLALLTLTTFVEDGQRLSSTVDGRHRRHDTLLVCGDAESAFCKANCAHAMQRLRAFGMHAEAFWIGRFLTERKLRVKECDTFSALVDLDSGVPQGTILGPLLWSLCVEPLLLKLEAECRMDTPGGTTASVPITYADDINFAVRGADRRNVVARANKMLELVDEWSRDTGINIGSLKATWIEGTRCGVSPTHVATPPLQCGDVGCTPGDEPIRMLGVWFDSSFTFASHLAKLRQGVFLGLQTVRSLSNAVSADMVRIAYRALVLERMLYAAEAWFFYASSAVRKEIERIHLDGCRLITRAPYGAQGASVILEAGLRNVAQIVTARAIKVQEQLKREPLPAHYEKDKLFGAAWLRVRLAPGVGPQPVGGNAGDAVALSPPTASPSPSSGVPASLLRSLLDVFEGDENLPHVPRYIPYLGSIHALSDKVPPEHFQFSNPGGLVKAQCTVEQLYAANQARIDALPDDAILVYTDGSTRMRSCGRRGAAVGSFAICHRGAWIHTQVVPVGPYACAFVAECTPLHAAVEWLRGNAALFPGGARACFITDSQSAIRALAKGPLRQTDMLPMRVWSALALLVSSPSTNFVVSFHFIFSHAGTAGNELADSLAGDLLDVIGDSDQPLWITDATRHRIQISNAMSDVENTVLDDETGKPKRPRPGPSPSLKPLCLSRRDEQLLYRARIGATPEIGGALQDSYEPCPRCGAADALGRAGRTMRHIFVDCPHRDELTAKLPPEALKSTLSYSLWNEPLIALEYLRTFRDAAAFDEDALLDDNEQDEEDAVAGEGDV